MSTIDTCLIVECQLCALFHVLVGKDADTRLSAHIPFLDNKQQSERRNTCCERRCAHANAAPDLCVAVWRTAVVDEASEVGFSPRINVSVALQRNDVKALNACLTCQK